MEVNAPLDLSLDDTMDGGIRSLNCPNSTHSQHRAPKRPTRKNVVASVDPKFDKSARAKYASRIIASVAVTATWC